MKVDGLVKLLGNVSGLSVNESKTAIYYCAATHKLRHFDWFPALCLVGPPGTGKSTTIDALYQLCYKPLRIACHLSMTPAALRDDLVKAKGRTAIVEEVDQCPNRKLLLSYIINRVDRTRTADVTVKEMVETESGAKKWAQYKKTVHGATILHDRNVLDDLAAETRVISIHTIWREGSFIDAPHGLTLPNCKLGQVPAEFATGRMLNTWRPLVMIAAGMGDTEFLAYARLQIRESTEELKDGQSGEEGHTVFAKLVEAYCNNSMGLVVTPSLSLEANVTEPLRRVMPYITSQLVRKILTKMGFIVRRDRGALRLFTTEMELRAIAKAIGYKDDLFANDAN